MRFRIVERLRGTRPADDPEREARATFSADAATLFPSSLTPAAVVLPLIDRPAGLSILMTRRSASLRDHPGQISLPGGRVDAHDADALATALRELWEELRIPARFVEVAGYLPPQAVVTGFVITPVVGFLPDGIDIQPDPVEVAEVFEVPLDFIMDPVNQVVAPRRVRGVDLTMIEFRHGPHRIWGATALILDSLRKIMI